MPTTSSKTLEAKIIDIMKSTHLISRIITLLIGYGICMHASAQERLIGTIDLSAASPSTSVTIDYLNADPITAIDMDHSNLKLKIVLDMGDNIAVGSSWTYSCVVSPNNGGGSASLSVSDQQPEQAVIVSSGISNNSSQTVTFTASNISSGLGFATNNSLNPRILIYRIDERRIDVRNFAGSSSSSKVSSSSMVSEGLYYSSSDQKFRRVALSWNSPVAYSASIYKWELQVLKVEPTSSNGEVAPLISSSDFDWSKALTVILPESQYEFTPSQGTGYYAWRVRAVGNMYDGGEGDSRNFGQWNTADDALPSNVVNQYTWLPSATYGDYNVTISGSPSYALSPSINQRDLFYYEQFDESQNWIYNHVFSEGGREKETMTYANGLQQTEQVQTKLESSHKVFGTQTVYDFSGRPSLSTMAAPTGEDAISFDSYFFVNSTGNPYSASDFDSDNNIFNNDQASGDPVEYYSDDNTGGFKNQYIPAADGQVYTRTQYLPDATGRPWRQAGVGDKFQLSESTDANLNHNVSYEYATPAQDELDRIFGSEAPLARTVTKVQTTDQNGVKSVSYVSKAGKTLATMLNNDVLLENLDNVGNDEFEVVDYLPEGTWLPGTEVSSTSKVIMVTGNEDFAPGEPKVSTVTLDYTLTPSSFGYDCDGTPVCEQCDYKVEISIRDLQYPDDPDRNAIITFDIEPPTNFTCSTSIAISSLFPSANVSNESLKDGQGLDNTSAHFSNLTSSGEAYLKTGTYQITKKVFINSAINSSGITYKQQHLDELFYLYQNVWTADDNCCGVITPDPGNFNCDGLEDIDCDNDPDLNDKLDQITDMMYDHIVREQEEILTSTTTGSSADYYTMLSVSSASDLAGYAYYNNKSGLRTKIEEWICTDGIPSSNVIACIMTYGEGLNTNIVNAEKVFSGQGNTGLGNINVLPDFDFYFRVSQCLGKEESYCGGYKAVVFYTPGSPTTIEATIAGLATGNTSYKYIVVYENTDGPISFIGTVHENLLSQIKQVAIPPTNPSTAFPDPNNPYTQAMYEVDAVMQNCYNNFKYPSVITNGMSESEARAHLAKLTCECIENSDPINASGTTSDDILSQSVSSCEDRCINKETAFEVAIDNYILNKNIEDFGIYSDETDPSTGHSIWTNAASPSWSDFGLGTDKSCMVDLMTAQCLQQCQMYLTRSSEDIILEPLPIVASNYISGSQNTYSTLQDFIGSQEFRDALSDEQEAFQQAMLYGSEFAPFIDNPTAGNGYSNFGTNEQVQVEIIDFINKSINDALNYRNTIPCSTVSSAPFAVHSSASHPVTYEYEQSLLDIVYNDGTDFYELDVVTNVIVNPGLDATTFDDDEIREINIAIYCDNSYTSALASWAYLPTNHTTCSGINGHILMYDFATQFANIYFDNYGNIHAVSNTDICDPSSVEVSSSITQSGYAAQYTFDIQAGNNGDFIMLEAGAIGNTIYLMDQPVYWNTSVSQTAEDIVDEINGTYSAPGYFAESSGATITIYLSGSPDEPYAGDKLYKTGTQPTDIASSNEEDIVMIGTSLSTVLSSSGCTTIIDNEDNECPYGYMHLNHTTVNGYNLTNTNLIELERDRDQLEYRLVEFYDKALRDILVYRSAVNYSDLETISLYPNQTGFTFYEITEKILINGVWFTAAVSAKGVESSTDIWNNPRGVYYTLEEINLSLFCDGGTPLVFGFSSPSNIFTDSGYDDNLFNGLQATSDGLLHPSALSASIPYFFNSIDVVYNSGGIHYINFNVNHINIGLSTSISLSDGAVDNGPITEFNGGCTPPVISCDACLKWNKPESVQVQAPSDVYSCEDALEDYLAAQIAQALNACYEEKQQELVDSYSSCLENYTDELSVTYKLNYGQYTLYYYDRAGNLIQTVPPKGVDPLDLTAAEKSDLSEYRSGGLETDFVATNHSMITQYKYNGIGQLIWQETPDGGETHFGYNALGQLVISQDAAQLNDDEFSYTRYDALGRIVETGVFVGNGTNTVEYYATSLAWNTIDFPYQTLSAQTPLISIASVSERTYTRYGSTTTLTEPTAIGGVSFTYENVRNRIVEVSNDDGYKTKYSYDPHGNVNLLLQYIPELGYKSVEYDYDLISGNVKEVCYNCAFDNENEMFIHRYSYDEDNRIVKVETSTNGILWENDANYQYFDHGPLSRVELGEDKIQGIDYTYTLEGYLKSLNQSQLKSRGMYDPGQDGALVAKISYTAGGTGTISNLEIQHASGTYNLITSSIDINGLSGIEIATEVVNQINEAYVTNATTQPFRADNENGTSSAISIYSSDEAEVMTGAGGLDPVIEENFSLQSAFAEDEFGMELGYYDGDFHRTESHIGGNTQSIGNPETNPYLMSGEFSTTRNSLYNGNISHWISNTRSGQDASKVSEAMGTKVQRFRYDALNRLTGSVMREYDDAQQQYITSNLPYKEDFTYDNNGNIETAQRTDIEGDLIDNLVYDYIEINGEITNQLDFVDEQLQQYSTAYDLSDNQTAGNYKYYDNGALLRDEAEKITIYWNNLKKVEKVLYDDDSEILFDYDAMGNRIKKEVRDTDKEFTEVYYYVRDAQGNVMATYKKYNDAGNTKLDWIESPVYGSSRLGLYRPNENISSLQSTGQTFADQTVASTDPTSVLRTTGLKAYELTDHLGNVRAVVSDYKNIETESNPVVLSNDFATVSDWTQNYRGSNVIIKTIDNKLNVTSSQNSGGIEYPFVNKLGKVYLLSFGLLIDGDVTAGYLGTDKIRVKLVDNNTNEFYISENIQNSGYMEIPFACVSNDLTLRIDMVSSNGTNETFELENLKIEEMAISQVGQEIGFPYTQWTLNGGVYSSANSTNSFDAYLFYLNNDEINTDLSQWVAPGEYYFVDADVSTSAGNTIKAQVWNTDGGEVSYITTNEFQTISGLKLPFKANVSSNKLEIFSKMNTPVQLDIYSVKLYKLSRKGVVYAHAFNSVDNWRKQNASKLEISGGQMEITSDGVYFDVKMDLETEVGKYYKMKLDLIPPASGKVYLSAKDQDIYVSKITETNGTRELIFRAASSETVLYIGSNNSGGVISVDNIEIREMEINPVSSQMITNTNWAASDPNISVTQTGNTELDVVINSAYHNEGAELTFAGLNTSNYYLFEADLLSNNGNKVQSFVDHGVSTEYDKVTYSYDGQAGVAFKPESSSILFQWRTIINNNGNFNIDNMYLYQLTEGNLISFSDFEDYPLATGNSELTYENDNELSITSNAQNDGIEYSFASIAGKEYELSFDLDKSASTVEIKYEVQDQGTTPGLVIDESTTTETGRKTLRFVAVSPSSKLKITRNDNTGGTENFDVDNLLVQETTAFESEDDFTTLNGWKSSGPSLVQYDAGKLVVSLDQNDYIYFEVPTQPGKDYTVNIDHDNNTISNLKFQIINDFGGTGQTTQADVLVTGNGTINQSFAGSTSKITILLKNENTTTGVQTVDIDNLIVTLDGNYDHYVANTLSMTDYYAFGGVMPGRTYSSDDYRYGFQGQEKDDEIKGRGNSINYRFRMHDPRIGRFFSIDPLAPEYAYNSPYAFSENDLIRAVELEGLEKAIVSERTTDYVAASRVTIYYLSKDGNINNSNPIDLKGLNGRNTYMSSAILMNEYDGGVVMSSDVKSDFGNKSNIAAFSKEEIVNNDRIFSVKSIGGENKVLSGKSGFLYKKTGYLTSQSADGVITPSSFATVFLADSEKVREDNSSNIVTLIFRMDGPTPSSDQAIQKFKDAGVTIGEVRFGGNPIHPDGEDAEHAFFLESFNE